jgi:hypothetical protein
MNLTDKYPDTERLEEETPTGGAFAPATKTGNSLLDMDVSGLVGRLFPGEDFSGEDEDPPVGPAERTQQSTDEPTDAPTDEPTDEPIHEPDELEPQAQASDPPAQAPQHPQLQELFADAPPQADLVALAAEEITALRASVDQERQASDRLASIFETNPEMTALVRALDRGASFMQALASAVDLEEMIPDPATDPEGYREYVKGRAMRELHHEQAKADQERIQNELSANQSESAKVVRSFITDKELSDQDWTRLGTQIDTFLAEAVKGRISTQLLEVFYKGLHYETATQAARQDGVVAGRNQAVSKIQKQKAGDGLPSPVRKAASEVRATPLTHADPVRESIRQAATMTPSRFA